MSNSTAQSLSLSPEDDKRQIFYYCLDYNPPTSKHIKPEEALYQTKKKKVVIYASSDEEFIQILLTDHMNCIAIFHEGFAPWKYEVLNSESYDEVDFRNTDVHLRDFSVFTKTENIQDLVKAKRKYVDKHGKYYYPNCFKEFGGTQAYRTCFFDEEDPDYFKMYGEHSIDIDNRFPYRLAVIRVLKKVLTIKHLQDHPKVFGLRIFKTDDIALSEYFHSCTVENPIDHMQSEDFVKGWYKDRDRKKVEELVG